MMRSLKDWSPAARLVLVALLTVLAGIAFMTWNVRASWAFTLSFRGEKLIAIALVGYCIALSTVLFQTLTHNRILTPGIMGFDALYLLLQSVLVFTLGNLFYVQINAQLKWLLDVAVMTGAICALYYWLFVRQRRDLHLLVLVGLIFGVLFRSFTSLITRMMDPAEFDALQDVMFASFNRIDSSLLGISLLVAAIVSALLWRARHAYDVLSLGDDPAISLGLDQRTLVMRTLVGIAILVSISTALVGPVTFFGLLVANLAYALAGTHQHRYILPMAGLLAVVMLLGGQAILEHLLHFGTGLSILIEFGGGLFFILLVIRQGRR
ncbi:iron chelate uptake ABC transporter family permease subunit [Saccharospirillum sp. HFRX-1]|uniref:iron chelate uptake ABC transporter family permease subunit n=1 Tax=unclassified Saccharospirillum TaxID=2633430 RepID=UPI0037232A72